MSVLLKKNTYITNIKISNILINNSLFTRFTLYSIYFLLIKNIYIYLIYTTRLLVLDFPRERIGTTYITYITYIVHISLIYV